MQQIIELINNDLSTILINSSMDQQLCFILELLINIFSYTSYFIIIIYIFFLCKNMLEFVFKGGKNKWKIF